MKAYRSKNLQVELSRTSGTLQIKGYHLPHKKVDPMPLGQVILLGVPFQGSVQASGSLLLSTEEIPTISDSDLLCVGAEFIQTAFEAWE